MKPHSMLQETYKQLIEKYTTDTPLIRQCWRAIAQHYSSEGRYYHSLQHLENLLIELTAIKHLIKDWDTVLFSLFYHDVVYDVLKTDNEGQSAVFAAEHMKILNVPTAIIEACYVQILATKQHLLSNDNDTNLFTDADLGILGQSWEVYELYAKNVRKEYIVYPDELYMPGRRKVLEHFLNMERIYKTDYFNERLEIHAKENLKKELEQIKDNH